MSSQPQKTTLNETINCKGFTIRTKNADEMNSETAKIGKLWQNFQHQLAGQISENSQIYGIYHNYESDVNGKFDVTACIEGLDNSGEYLNTVTIEAGEYLVFRKQGEMPEAVIGAWGDVWNYFTTANCPHIRTYNIDFEKYIDPDTVEVYIGVTDK